MNGLSKYQQAFKDTFMIEEEKLSNLSYQSIPEWDSVGHMSLMAAIEETFDISLEMDDVIDFSSYEYGMQMLKKYGINF